MMGHRQVDQAALFYEFSLEAHIPADHLLRSIDRFVEFGEVRRELASFYSTMGRPSVDPDLMIRTSGEMRISNFLLWQIAYSEIYVTETLWPDFKGTSLLEAIADFQRRERRFGGVEAMHAVP